MRLRCVRPEYVEFIPKNLEEGTLYISKQFSTASHLCCCGCETKIVTPLRETEYSLTERNGRVSLRPSIGNWNYPCQSHYWIRDNRVIWARRMSKEAIRKGRMLDDKLREAHFKNKSQPWWHRALVYLLRGGKGSRRSTGTHRADRK